MRTRTFVVCMSTLIIAGASLFYYQEQDSILVVRAGLTLRVLRKSSEKSGFGWIANRNTNVSLIKWPNMAFESVNIDLTQDYNETRITPVKSTVSFFLNQTERTVTTSGLTKKGQYDGSATSFFARVKSGTYNLTITIQVVNSTEIEDRLNRFITIF